MPKRYSDICWMSSTGENNLCGFAAIDNIIQELVQANRLVINDNLFVREYYRRIRANHASGAANRAQILKQTFADFMQQEEKDTPFDLVMEADLLGYLRGATDTQYDEKLIKGSILENKLLLDKHHEEFAKAHPLKIDDNTAFYSFLCQRDKELIQHLKQRFLQQLVAADYQAKNMDMLYILSQLKCFGVLVIHNLQANRDPARSEIVFDPNQSLELHLRNTGNHWEAGHLDFSPAAPAPAATPAPRAPSPAPVTPAATNAPRPVPESSVPRAPSPAPFTPAFNASNTDNTRATKPDSQLPSLERIATGLLFMFGVMVLSRVVAYFAAKKPGI